MNKIKLIILLVALIVCGSSARLFGQTPLPPFDCTSSGMILTQGNGSNLTTFYHVNTSTSPFTFDQMFQINYNVNSTGYNPVDNLLYAFPTVGTSANPTTMIRVGAGGGYDELTVAGTGYSGGYKGGTFDDKNNFFLAPNTAASAIYYVNLNSAPTYTQHSITLSTSVNLPDLAWNPADGKLYGVDATSGKLVVITPTYNASGIPTSATVTTVGANSTLNQFGAMYLGSNGAVFGSLNGTAAAGGAFYQFNIATGARTLISPAPYSTVNDGANCPLVSIAFGADIQITKTDNTDLLAPGQTHTYTVTVTNNGPFGAEGVVVTDTIPHGIPAANITYTAAIVNAPNGNTATTTITGTGTGMLRDTVSLEVGSSVVYTVKLVVPDDYKSLLLENCASAIPGSSTIDPDMSNNTTCDIDKTPYIPVNPNVRVWMRP